VSYLRFTPEEFKAIEQACHSMNLSDDFFHVFKYFLIESLEGTLPSLTQRLAQLPSRKLRILYEFLRDQRTSPVKNHGGGTNRDRKKGALSFEELQAVRQASGSFFLYDGSQWSFQDYLVHDFGKTAPALAAKLARFSHQQIARLYHQEKKRNR
jgi:hypothetical protein